MNHSRIDKLLENIKQGKRCSWLLEDDEFSTSVSIEQNDDIYAYTRSIRHKYDVVAPTQYDHRTLNEEELRALLSQVPEDVFQMISYSHTEIIDESTRAKVALIYSFLRQGPRRVYVVFKDDRHEASRGEQTMHFNGLYKDLERADAIVDYLKKKQGARAYSKPITLTLNNGEMYLQADLSPFDRVNAQQILATLLDLDPAKLANFFED